MSQTDARRLCGLVVRSVTVEHSAIIIIIIIICMDFIRKHVIFIGIQLHFSQFYHNCFEMRRAVSLQQLG